MIVREVVVLVEPKGPDHPAVIRRGRRTWEQYLSPEMLAEIGDSPLALYSAEEINKVWMFGKRIDLNYGAKSVLKQMIERPDGQL